MNAMSFAICCLVNPVSDFEVSVKESRSIDVALSVFNYRARIRTEWNNAV